MNSIFCMDHILFIRSSFDGHLGCFCFLAVVNAAVCMVYRWLFETLPSVLLGLQPEVELVNPVVVFFLALRGTTHPVFYRGCSILHFHQQGTQVLISPHPQQQLLFSLPPPFFLSSSLFLSLWVVDILIHATEGFILNVLSYLLC